jgi:dCTP diphosphatase
MDPTTLESVASDLRAFVAERNWDRFHSPKNLAMALGSEVGELLAEFRWLTNDESVALSRDRRDRVAEEIGDVLLVLISLSERLDIDLLAAARAKLSLNQSQYPVAASRGRAERPPRA